MSSDQAEELNIYEEITRASIPFLSDDWKRKNGRFMQQEYFERFSAGLISLLAENWHNRLPQFDQEVHPDFEEIKTYFEDMLPANGGQLTKKLAMQCGKKIENAPFHYLLTVMGQRFTPASAKDITALPPLTEILLESSFSMYNDQICMATRAWEKHIGRSDDQFWGEMRGSQSEKDKKVRALIVKMIEEQTWWNIFFHYKHELVFEMRVATGHGIRWNSAGTQLIGFLEPFLQE